LSVVPISNDRGAVTDADEPGAPVCVHHGLVGLKDAEGAKAHLQEFRAGDRVQGCRGVHAGQVRQRD
jgi:hypothetical protein